MVKKKKSTTKKRNSTKIGVKKSAGTQKQKVSRESVKTVPKRRAKGISQSHKSLILSSKHLNKKKSYKPHHVLKHALHKDTLRTAKNHVKKHATNYTKQSIQTKFDHKKEFKKRRMSKIFTEFLDKSGVQSTPKAMLRKVFRIDLMLIIFVSLITIFSGVVYGSNIRVIISLLLQTWTILFVAVYLLSLLIVFFYLDVKISNRTQQIEEVLPDFLQLTSANISAGMTIDRALWFAVRPRFGVLAKEIEEIAKSTIAGEDLSASLMDFTRKYDSKILKESVNLIVAGIRSGGELGELLNKISENILDTKLMKKEVSASVTTYVIFIGVASILAAPGLFALSAQLLVVIQNIAGNLASSGGGAGAGGLSMSFGSDSITLKDFKIFSVVLLSITAYFAAQIISVIRKGDGRDGLKNFPLFTVISLTGFFFMSYVLGLLLNGLF